MYAVIFRAEIKELNEQYFQTAQRMREMAIEQYGCIGFTSCSEGNHETTISYWETKEQIKAWKQNVEHVAAQTLGQGKWYKSYRAQLVEVLHEYEKTL